MRSLATLMFVLGSLANNVIAYAQQTSVRTPVMNSSDSFFEQFGITWSMRGNGWFFNGPGLAPPPFGGFDPNAGLQGGFGFGGGGMSGRLNFYAGQGSSSGFGSHNPMVTIPHGGSGSIIDTNYRPFITQLTPVLGESPVAKILREQGVPRIPLRLPEEAKSAAKTSEIRSISVATSSGAGKASSASKGDLSLAEIRRQQVAEDASRTEEFEQILQEAQTLENTGDLKAAASFFARAAMRVEGKQREALLLHSRELRKK